VAALRLRKLLGIPRSGQREESRARLLIWNNRTGFATLVLR
jgi:hypothetical protein